MSRRNRTFPQLAAIIVLNEIIPRYKKNGNRFPPAYFMFLVILLEQAGRIDRKRLRLFLDDYYSELEQGTIIPWKYEYKHYRIGLGLDEDTALRLIEEREYVEYFETLVYWFVTEFTNCIKNNPEGWKKLIESQPEY